MAEPAERLQKVLARAGLGSRREIERWIDGGRVAVDGRVATPGERVAPGARIEVDGKPVAAGGRRQTRVLLYHKPCAEICTRRDPAGRSTVFERLPPVKSGRWVAIGRLDYNSSGLLLFTTDGELAHALMHPSAAIEREYLVRVRGAVSAATLQTLRTGVMLEDGMARFSDIQEGGGSGSNRWYYVVIMEGRTREVRRLWESQGCVVSRLKRTRYGNVLIPARVRQGHWLELDAKAVQELYRQGGLTPRPAAPATPPQRRRQRRQLAKRS